MTPAILRVVCSWCQAVLTEGSPGAPTSHAMCASCAATINAQLDAVERGKHVAA